MVQSKLGLEEEEEDVARESLSIKQPRRKKKIVLLFFLFIILLVLLYGLLGIDCTDKGSLGLFFAIINFFSQLTITFCKNVLTNAK